MQEMIDIFDENQNKLNISLPRKEVHQKGLWHIASGCVIVNNNLEILSQKRSIHKDKNAGLWDLSASGHIPAGEDAQNSLLREIKEELGLDIKGSELHLLGVYRRQETHNDGKFLENEFDYIYVIKKDIKISDIAIQQEEVDDAKYFSAQEFEKMLADGKVVKRVGVWDDLFHYIERMR